MSRDYAQGIEAAPADLIRARPDRSITGFAPGGRVSTHLWGANRSVFRGRGMEYAESRAYQPGDEPRAIDWRLTARSGETWTKLYHEERERPVYLLIDLRRSMQFGTRTRFKAHLAAEIAATLAWTGHDGGDRVGATILTRSGLVEVAPSRSRAALLGLLKRISDGTLLAAETGGEAAMDAALKRLTRVCRPGTLAFVISDFADLDASEERELRRLSRRAHVTCIAVFDRMEAGLPRRGGKLSDGRAAVSVGGLSAAARDRHAQDFAKRRERLAALCARLGMACHWLSTEDAAASVLMPRARRATA
ncbi:DUF58 domain-containing protein [Roseibacterium sp. SDUM158016]|jgi:uncharacterized protein (DUF58 family)|uniref:DUF58 domain-containing protein n=1 Tax=Roseicyclus sediminis TaxID=2980997 RepID=UPI0021D16DD0|nr:DUF58 domain-containing protein [Roseibacterium sp. SDUM158016]MCU4653297.1 DUF58 domain-containing protein [Roseibacterium sp. SDUM158016]